jgi:hypothetical protein
MAVTDINNAVADFGAKTDGTDTSTELNNWLAADGRIKVLPGGEYTIDAPLKLGKGVTRIVGAGRRASVIKAGASFTPSTEPMLDIFNTNPSPTVLSNVTLENVGFLGNSNTTIGLRLGRANFCYLNQVEVRSVNGRGVWLEGVQDSEFRGLDVRHCGNFGSSLPGIHVSHWTGNVPQESNSLFFSGGCYERNHYPFVLDSTYSSRIVGMKFHGRLSPDDEQTPSPADLLQLINAFRISIDACHFAHARRNSMLVTGADSSALVTACHFTNPINYNQEQNEFLPAWHIVVENGRVMVANNFFSHGTHASYRQKGGDVWLKENTLLTGGINMHLWEGSSSGGIPFTTLKRDYTGGFILPSISGIRVQMIWSGGHLAFGAHRVWVHSNGKLYIKNGPPSSEGDGTIVGTQS